MWRPTLPELMAGKADTDCPSQGDYCEVCLMYKKILLRVYRKNINLRVVFHSILPYKHETLRCFSLLRNPRAAH